MDALLVEKGVLLDKNDFRYAEYHQVYDWEHGYYDEDQHYSVVNRLEEEKQNCIDFVKEKGEKAYAIISNTMIEYDFSQEELDELKVGLEEYLLPNVVFAVAMIDGNIVENFFT